MVYIVRQLHVGMERTNFRWRSAGIALTFGAMFAAATADAHIALHRPFTAVVLGAAEYPGTDCAARLTKFVKALDGLLGSNPSSEGPISALLEVHFPMEKCDIDEAIKISRQSKFFFSASNHTGYYTIVFNNGGYFDGLGFRVGFAILKTSGNSYLPYALPNRERIVR